MSNLKIVCVDDEQNILEYYESVFADQEFDVVSFTSPLEVIDYLSEHQKDVLMIFCDLNMPEMSGLELREKLLNNDILVPFAVITGFYSKEMAKKGMELKVCDFLEKPCTAEVILNILNQEAGNRIEAIAEEREMVLSFLEESSSMLKEIEELILILEDYPDDDISINTYFRLLHTIKGTSSCLGLGDLASFAHKYEDLITKVKNGELAINKSVVDVLLKGVDYLSVMYNCEKNEEKYPFAVDEVVSIFEQKFDKDASGEKVQNTGAKNFELKKTEKEDSVNVSVEQLTGFLEHSGELTVLKNTIFKSLTKLHKRYHSDQDFELLSESIQEMHKVSSILQGEVSELKKISIDSVFRSMKRVVRDASKSCNKKVNFVTEGEGLRIDTTVGKLLSNVLVHMLRNSVDHGIESPEVRVEKGKHETGKVTLKCHENGEHIFIEIIDDGNGLNKEKIISKALEKEIVTESDLEKMSDNRIFNLIFDSGFSTAEKVTAVSGRGVGMDMVRSSIEEFNGKIYIESEQGKGSKFILVIPIPRSILIIKSLGVMVGGLNFNIPLDNISEVAHVDKLKNTSLFDIDKNQVFKHHDQLLPLLYVGDLLDLQSQENDFINIVIVRGEGFKYGLVVDEIEDIEEIVVKKMAYPLSQINYFMGVTFVGDGDLNLILDLEGIANSNDLVSSETQSEDFYDLKQVVTNTISESEYMRFKIGELNNYCLPLEKVFRLEVFSTSEVQFTGSRAVVRYRDRALPLTFVNIDLGHEISCSASDVLNREELNVIVINGKEKQFGLVIDEILEIESTSSEINDSLVTEKGMLGTTFINDKIVTVIDVDYFLDEKGIVGSGPQSNLDRIKAS